MIGMPAAFALPSEPLIASAFGTETASPSTFCDTAASISCASFCGSLLEGLQISFTPSALAAAWAPFFTTDQNEPSSLCVTIANVRPDPWVRSTLSQVVDAGLAPSSSAGPAPGVGRLWGGVVGGGLPHAFVFLWPPPPHPTAKIASANASSSPRPLSRRLIVLQPLSREPA